MLKVDARSLAGLCEDIGTPAQNEQFNKVRLGVGLGLGLGSGLG